MTTVSEQGMNGILWTIFEGAPFTSRRIASFGSAGEAGMCQVYLQNINTVLFALQVYDTHDTRRIREQITAFKTRAEKEAA